MADERKRFDSAVELNVSDLKALDPQVLAELNEKHGLEIQVRSSSAAIDKILGGLGRSGLAAGASEFTRGFDRTSDMYSKFFDRDYKMVSKADLVTNPVVDPVVDVSRLSLEEALKQLSLEDLARLKSGR